MVPIENAPDLFRPEHEYQKTAYQENNPGSGLGEKNIFDITEGKEAVLSIGEPIVATLDASESEGTHSFRHGMKGRAGERIVLTRNGAQPQAPTVRISSADDTYDRTFSFQYG